MAPMNHAPGARHGVLFVAAAVLVVVLGILSAIAAPKRTYTGFGMDGMHKVRTVEPNSPAAQAGIQVGDILKSVNGVLVTDTKASFSVGSTARWHDLMLQRGAETVHLTISPAPLPAGRLYLARAAILIGLCFVGFPLWAYLAAPGRPTAPLAVFGLAFGATILITPNFQSPTVSLIVFEAMWILAFLGTAALLHFVLTFPSPVRFVARPWGTTMLYGPVLVLALTIGALTVSQREAAQALGGSLILFFGIYFLVAIAALFWRYVTASPDSRRAHGLRLMLISVIVVLVLPPVHLVVSSIWPGVAALPYWPPSEYFALAMVTLVPIGFSMAAVRSARKG